MPYTAAMNDTEAWELVPRPRAIIELDYLSDKYDFRYEEKDGRIIFEVYKKHDRENPIAVFENFDSLLDGALKC